MLLKTRFRAALIAVPVLAAFVSASSGSLSPSDPGREVHDSVSAMIHGGTPIANCNTIPYKNGQDCFAGCMNDSYSPAGNGGYDNLDSTVCGDCGGRYIADNACNRITEAVKKAAGYP